MFVKIIKAFKVIPAIIKLTMHANKGNMKSVDWGIDHILNLLGHEGEDRELMKTYLTLKLAKATTNRRMRAVLVMRYSEFCC